MYINLFYMYMYMYMYIGVCCSVHFLCTCTVYIQYTEDVLFLNGEAVRIVCVVTVSIHVYTCQ